MDLPDKGSVKRYFFPFFAYLLVVCIPGVLCPVYSNSPGESLRYLSQTDSSETVYTDVDVSPDSSLLVTGIVNKRGNSQGLFLRLNLNGELVHKSTFGEPGNLNASDIAGTSEGAVYVLGNRDNSIRLWKLSRSGELEWTRSLNVGWRNRGRGVDVDEAGNAYITGTDGRNWVTAKYNPAGEKIWQEISESRIRYDGSSDLQVWQDRVIVTGEFNDDGYRTIQYDHEGNEIWKREFDGPGNDRPYALHVAQSGDLYVTGKSLGKHPDYTRVIKYDSDGSEQWNVVPRRDEGKNEIPSDITVGPDGIVYVAGTRKNKGNKSAFLVDYNPRIKQSGSRVLSEGSSGGANSLSYVNGALIGIIRDNDRSYVFRLEPEKPDIEETAGNLNRDLDRIQKQLGQLEDEISSLEQSLEEISSILEPESLDQ